MILVVLLLPPLLLCALLALGRYEEWIFGAPTPAEARPLVSVATPPDMADSGGRPELRAVPDSVLPQHRQAA
ncbi:hypothetical protein ACN20G_32060 (plasmid) [Streptomyces sp. BI20]|uniref:hypothetical protein n=1 Tax=Streptomyces sp. BI20 TaxID=3403460 RepID=UPI003C72B84E